MGGRGGASGMTSRTSGLDVTVRGETTRYYFTNANGQNFYQRGIGGMPEPTPLNMSAKEFRQRVESSGASAKTVSNAERLRDEKKYKADREETDRFLNAAEFNKMASKGTKINRLMNKPMRGSR